MNRLSTSGVSGRYEIVVVGSGYGGAIAASRLARAGRRVCLLERGKEFVPGEFPDTLLGAVGEYQIDTPEGRFGPRTGLYDLHVNREINVFKGCGLGGTSLVNANVALPPDDRVFDDERWPARLRGKPAALGPGYERARSMFGSTPYPEDWPKLPKLEAHERSARHLGGAFRRLPINVTFEEGKNEAGVWQPACSLCGNCISGCNHGSKNSLIMNYLPDARNWGAEIFTLVDVRYLERQGEGWRLHVTELDAGHGAEGREQTLEADVVILSAGTLGSTEVLLRSREHGLEVSSTLGRGFTGNGDALGFGYNADVPIRGVGWAHQAEGAPTPAVVGPCITSAVNLRGRPELRDGILLEEGSVPGLLREVTAAALAGAAPLLGEDTDPGVIDGLREWARKTVSLASAGKYGATENTQIYLVMAHDDAAGRMTLENDRLRIHWPGVGEQPIFEKASQTMLEATRALGGTYVKNPAWTELAGHDLVTVHPLGGCCMADSAEHGVVDDTGHVFRGSVGGAVYENLLVCDGSIVPTSVGVNPLLTIAALAERNIEHFATARGWSIDYGRRGPG